MRKTFIYDYDDTLAWCEHDYCHAALDFMRFVIGRLQHKAPDVESILKIQSQLNHAGVIENGFAMEVFPSSCREAYEKICAGIGIQDEEGAEIAYRIGMRVFDAKKYREQGLVEGAKETLEFLIKQRDELILLTKGDERVQRTKINSTDAWRYFSVNNIHIVNNKNADVIRKVLAGRDKNRAWHVGNSIRSDVMPALEAGIKVIYIPCETWAYEREHNGVPESNRIVRFERILDIKHNYHLL